MTRAFLVLLLVTACGPSSQLVKKADQSAYDVEYPVLWNAIVATVRAEYPGLAVVDAVHGTIITKWKLIEKETSDQMTATGREQTLSITQEVLRPGKYFRLAVYVKAGGPPWQLEVDGEAMQYKTGMAMVTPWAHGDADEPPWVQTRIDKIKVGVYQRLASHARTTVHEAPRPGELDLGPWKNLPPPAATVVGQLYTAAHKKDAQAVRALMIPDFVWSEGGAPSAETALSMLQADPLLLSALERTLTAGCSERESELIVCPTHGGGTPGSYRVELRLMEGRWRFAAFYLEE